MFQYLDKKEKAVWLPRLFDLYYENMHTVAPTGLSCEEEKELWLAEVSPALDKAPRQIVLYLVRGELAGYLQYYIRDGMLMVEELQLKADLWQTTAFYSFCRYLLSVLPGDLRRVEAYAHKPNLRSLRLMERLGMKAVQEDEAPFVHMAGDAGQIRSKIGRRPQV